MIIDFEYLQSENFSLYVKFVMIITVVHTDIKDHMLTIHFKHFICTIYRFLSVIIDFECLQSEKFSLYVKFVIIITVVYEEMKNHMPQYTANVLFVQYKYRCLSVLKI